VLTDKVERDKFIVLDHIDLPEIKTKAMAQIFAKLGVTDGLLVMEGSNRNAILSARNIPYLKTAAVNTINVYDMLKHDVFVVTRDAAEKIQEVYA